MLALALIAPIILPSGTEELIVSQWMISTTFS